MAIVSLDSPSCEVPCLILHLVVYWDITRQAKGLHHLKYVGALESGLAYLSRCNSGWFFHTRECRRCAKGYDPTEPDDSHRRKPMICVRLGTRKEGRYVQSAHIYKKERKVLYTQRIELIE
jgi:hypothetical protein